MSAVLLKRLAISLAAYSAAVAGVLPIQADSKHNYPEAGTVISVTADHGDFYTIESGLKIYRMECIKANMFQSNPPQCDISGKPIAVKDRIHFRIDDDDDDIAYIPVSGNHEDRLLILSTELKVLPLLPTTTNPSAGKSCAVLGRGIDLVQSKHSLHGTTLTMPTGPVTAIPVTGGPPVQVYTGGPAIGGEVTGVPVTGGPPIVATPVAPVTGIQTGGTTTISESEWIPFLRVQTIDQVYKLACPSKYCWLKDREPQLGDLLTIRIQNKIAHLSWRPPGPKGEQKFVILSVNNIIALPAIPSH